MKAEGVVDDHFPFFLNIALKGLFIRVITPQSRFERVRVRVQGSAI